MLSGCCREIVGKSPEGLERTRKDSEGLGRARKDSGGLERTREGSKGLGRTIHGFAVISWQIPTSKTVSSTLL